MRQREKGGCGVREEGWEREGGRKGGWGGKGKGVQREDEGKGGGVRGWGEEKRERTEY